MPVENVVRFGDGSLVLEVVNEPPFESPAPDTRVSFQREEILGDAHFQLTSRHGLVSSRKGELVASVMFGATGGASGVHPHSLAVQGDRAFLAVGPYIVCVELPTLATRWVREVDRATCFGIHICPNHRSLISHGELEISRLTLTGDVLWRGGGPDIFSGALFVLPCAVLAEDFNGDTLSFDLETGNSILKRRPTSR